MGPEEEAREWGATRPVAQPKDDWISVPAPELRIFDPTLAAAIDARLKGQREIYLRGTRGTLASKPVNGMAAKYLLSGLATCGMCGGAFAPRLAGGTSRRASYRCLANHQKGGSVCANTWHVPVAVADTAIITVVQSAVLNPYAVEEAVKAVLARFTRTSITHERGRLRAALTAAEAKLANLSQANRARRRPAGPGRSAPRAGTGACHPEASAR